MNSMPRRSYAMPAINKRIEDPNLDVRMGIQRDYLLISRNGVAVVDQHPHP